jgi:hypothetical protein
MSGIGASNITLNGLKPKQDIVVTNNQQNVQLNGINWNQLPNNQQQQQPVQNTNPNWKIDGANVTQQNYGTVPSSDDIPPIFPDNQETNQTEKPAVVQKVDGTSTGVGMAIGAVGGALIGRRFGSTKIGIGLGLIVGGFAGHLFEN